ncbi:unnamed protein product [Linum trigynum]|uniref:No apical meristem-associated C-terminal domain-containing protein n=1 Tax=Linum trigynum TaxID=586398 RepID=A0AAV2E482_9ROSI
MSHSNRPPNWKEFEDKILWYAWIEISEDGVVGHYQPGIEFWRRVGVLFAERSTGISRPDGGLSNRWKIIQKKCGAWNAASRKASAIPMSGENLADVVKRTKSIYEADTGKDFNLHHCWEILQHCPKFLEIFHSSVPPIPAMGGSSSGMPSSESDSPDIQAPPFVINRPEGRDKQKKKNRGTPYSSSEAWDKSMATLVEY